jgi:hypothetical protein
MARRAMKRLHAGPATTVLPSLNPALAARLFPDAATTGTVPPPERAGGGVEPRRVWSLPDKCVPLLLAGAGGGGGRAPPQGFVSVTSPSTSSAADHRAVLLVDPTLSPPIRVVGYGLSAVDEAYVEGALREALAYRHQLASEARLEFGGDGHHKSAFRLVHELGDGLTALAIDVYGRHAFLTYSRACLLSASLANVSAPFACHDQIRRRADVFGALGSLPALHQVLRTDPRERQRERGTVDHHTNTSGCVACQGQAVVTRVPAVPARHHRASAIP